MNSKDREGYQMGKENNEILQAILELSEQLNTMDERLTGKINATEERLIEKIDIFDAKFSVLSEGLLKTQAEVKVLQSGR